MRGGGGRLRVWCGQHRGEDAKWLARFQAIILALSSRSSYITGNTIFPFPEMLYIHTWLRWHSHGVPRNACLQLNTTDLDLLPMTRYRFVDRPSSLKSAPRLGATPTNHARQEKTLNHSCKKNKKKLSMLRYLSRTPMPSEVETWKDPTLEGVCGKQSIRTPVLEIWKCKSMSSFVTQEQIRQRRCNKFFSPYYRCEFD